MKARFPHHAILLSLLDKKQFEACRTTVEDMIAEQMAASEPDDHELAYLHLFLCRALLGGQQYEPAGAKADIAVFLARKLKDWELVAEASYRGGFSYVNAGSYHNAIERFTACLDHGTDTFKAKALFNRGHVYERQHAFSFAAQDFDAAIRLAGDADPQLAQICRINLAWDLIVLRDFARAEEVLEQLSRAETSVDRYTQFQIAHDRLHMAFLKGEGRDALRSAMSALRESQRDYPEVKACIALTLLSLSVERGLSEQGFTMGVLTKRLAGRANRLDIEQEASNTMQTLEFQAGTDCLAQSLLRMGQVTSGSINARRSVKRGHQTGGVG